MTADESRSRIEAAVNNSYIITVVDTLERFFSRNYGQSIFEQAATWCRNFGSGSLLWRWITAEPDPQVIVIDLRNTYTVGPFFLIVDQFIELLDGAVANSRFVIVTRLFFEASRAAPIRTLGSIVAAGCGIALFGGTVLGVLTLLRVIILATLAMLGLAAIRISISWSEIVNSWVTQRLATAIKPLFVPCVNEESAGEEETEISADQTVSDE